LISELEENANILKKCIALGTHDLTALGYRDRAWQLAPRGIGNVSAPSTDFSRISTKDQSTI